MAFDGLQVAPSKLATRAGGWAGFWMLPDLFFSHRRARALALSELVAPSRNCPVRLRRTLGADVLIAPPRASRGSRTYTLNNLHGGGVGNRRQLDLLRDLLLDGIRRPSARHENKDQQYGRQIKDRPHQNEGR